MSHFCGAPTKKHLPCRHRVRDGIAQCWQHHGKPGGQDPSAEAAAQIAADVLRQGADKVIADRAADYVSARVWAALVDEARQPGDCREMAELAQGLRNAQQLVNTEIGRMAGEVVQGCGGSRAAVAFTAELVGSVQFVTLPLRAQMQLAARAFEIAGICACLINGRDLADCACLAQMLRSEGKAKAQQIVQGSLEDWQRLAAR